MLIFVRETSKIHRNEQACFASPGPRVPLGHAEPAFCHRLDGQDAHSCECAHGGRAEGSRLRYPRVPLLLCYRPSVLSTALFAAKVNAKHAKQVMVLLFLGGYHGMLSASTARAHCIQEEAMARMDGDNPASLCARHPPAFFAAASAFRPTPGSTRAT